jgi:hypothetical protein
MIIHRPTLDERPVLAATATALPAVEELILDWETKGSSQQSLEFFGAAWTHLAPRLRKLTLRTSVFDLDSFTTAAGLGPAAASLEAIHIEIRGRGTQNNLTHDIQLIREAAIRRSLSALVPVVARSSSTLKEITAVIDWQALRGFSAALYELSAVDLPRLVRMTVLGIHTHERSKSLSYIARPLCSMIQRHASTLEELKLDWSSEPNQIEAWLQSGRLPHLRKLVLHNEDSLGYDSNSLELKTASVSTLGRWFRCVPALQELSIRGRLLLEDQLLSIVPALAQCPALRTVELGHCWLTEEVVDELLRVCPSLAVLKCREYAWLQRIPPSRITIE